MRNVEGFIGQVKGSNFKIRQSESISPARRRFQSNHALRLAAGFFQNFQQRTDPSVGVVVSLRRIHFGEQETGLRSAVFRVDVARHGETRLQNVLRIIHRRLEQLSKVLVARKLVIAFRTPVSDCFSVINDDLEESVHQQDTIRLNGRRIQQNRLRATESVTVQDRLDHNQSLCYILTVQHVPIVSGLIRTVIEHLEERRPAQMEHKLRIKREIVANPETCWVVFGILAELLTLPS